MHTKTHKEKKITTLHSLISLSWANYFSLAPLLHALQKDRLFGLSASLLSGRAPSSRAMSTSVQQTL